MAQVSVTPGAGSVNVGATLQLQALVTNAQGTPLNNSVGWSSNPSSVGTVSSTGLVTGVAQGTVTVTASAGGRSGNATITVNDPNPPAAPTNVNATAVSDTEIVVTWTDNSNNETGFTIERETVTASPPFPVGGAVASPLAVFGAVGSVGANITTFRDVTVGPSTAYRYRVSASNGNGSTGSTASTNTLTHETLEVLTETLAVGTVNVPYAQALRAEGDNGEFAWRQTAGTMPPGLALQTGGSIQGTPTQEGEFELTLEVASGAQTLSMEYTVTINEEILPPEVVSTELPDGSVGNTYSADLEARLGDGSYVWELESGSLPAGLTLAVDGTVSGVPTAEGTSTFTVEVTSAELSGTGAVSITIRPPLGLATASLPTGVAGVPYAAQVSATGGDGDYMFTALTSLPPGIELAPSGALSGVPNEAGNTDVDFRVTSGDGQSLDFSLVLTVFDPLELVTEALANGAVGQAYSETLEASGGSGSETWSVTSGALPAGLTLAGAAGLIAGTPTTVGSAAFTVQVVSTDGQIASGDLAIEVVAGPVTVTTSTLPGGQVGTAYSTTLAASGGDGVGYAWAVATGSLPGGLTLNATTGVISGTPTVSGAFTFTVEATSSGQTGGKELSITISALPPVTVTTSSLAGGTVGAPYSQTLTASGGNGTFTWALTAGTLPTGLTLNAGSGVISGTPTAAGPFTFTVEATSAGLVGTRELSISVAAGGGGGGGFNITLEYLSSLSASHTAAFESARSRWEAIITADLPDFTGGLPDCGAFHPATPGDIDDLIIYVTVGPIDGPFGTIGQAGPCYTRTGTAHPITGAMTFDEDDLDFLASQGLLVATVLHEMGHVLGVGTLWEDMGLVIGSQCTADPAFSGAAAVAAFDAAGGAGYGGAKVPVENEGTPGDGSNCGHWRKTVFGTELMTKSLTAGAGAPLSAVTVESLGDQGYSVDASQADAYALPTAPSPPGAAPQGAAVTLQNDLLPTPIFRVHPDGRIERVRAGGGP